MQRPFAFILTTLLLSNCALAQGVIDEVLERFTRLPFGEFWPSFDPATTPLALYDGEKTRLIGFDRLPSGFEDQDGVFVMVGRPNNLTANTAISLDGILTASIMLPPRHLQRAPLLIGLFVHESFHVFQRKNHATWGTNEALLFTYPFTDSPHLAERRLENLCLKNALDDSRDDRWEWASLFCRTRSKRLSMAQEALLYERGIESYEGLAQYVETYAMGQSTHVEPLYSPIQPRGRCYDTGAAIAFLLDEVEPEWKHTYIQSDPMTLDVLLATALRDLGLDSEEANPDERTIEAIRIRAEQDTTETQKDRNRQLEDFTNLEGFTLIIKANSSPMACEGFDPLNVTVLSQSDGRVLHTRWLNLSIGSSVLEALDRTSLTHAKGNHPLFEGVRSVTWTGLEEPTFETHDSILEYQGQGLRLKLVGGTITKIGSLITVEL